MESPSTFKKVFLLIVILVGVLLGTAVVGIATWGDMETVLVFPVSTADKDLSNLKCPILISRKETGLVSFTIKNASTYTVTPQASITLSQGSTIITENFSTKPTVLPGTNQVVAWEVNATEAAYHESLILVQVFVTRSYPLPSRSGTCGIMVMDLGPFTGKTVIVGALSLSLAAMLLGTFFWIRSHRQAPGNRDTLIGGLIVLEVIVLVGIIASLLALWMVGLISFLISVLLMVILIARFGVDIRG